MRPDLAIYWTLGNFQKLLATINLPKSLTFLGKFFKVVKIYHFGQVLWAFGDFFWSHCGKLTIKHSSTLICFLRTSVARQLYVHRVGLEPRTIGLGRLRAIHRPHSRYPYIYCKIVLRYDNKRKRSQDGSLKNNRAYLPEPKTRENENNNN